jgi:hypothetical protein
LERRVIIQKESFGTLGVDEVERKVMVRKPVKKEQLVHLQIEYIMQITQKSLVSRVHWISVKHIKEAPFYTPTSLDDWVDTSFGRWLTKLVVIYIAGERFQTKILCSFFRCWAIFSAVEAMKV